jgi:hypothetical protein
MPTAKPDLARHEYAVSLVFVWRGESWAWRTRWWAVAGQRVPAAWAPFLEKRV